MNRKKRIEATLIKHLQPVFLTLEDESFKHHVPQGLESHFKIVLVSDKFLTLTKIMRHRLINKLLSEELKNGLHALSLHLYTEAEWTSVGKSELKSPPCRGGGEI